MATAAQAIDHVAKVTGIFPATVQRAARVLREADVALWPEGGQGRGRAAQVGVSHLVNLMLAIAIADPISEAPTTVAAYRNLWVTGYKTAVFQSEITRAPLAGLLVGSTLGQYLDAILPVFRDEATARREFEDGFFIILMKGPLRAAVGRSTWPEDTHAEFNIEVDPFGQLSFDEQLTEIDRTREPRPLLEKQAIVHAGLMTALASLISDEVPLLSMKDSEPLNTGGGAPSSLPEKQTAAIQPCQGPDAAVLDGQPVFKSPAPSNSANLTHTHKGESTPESWADRSEFFGPVNPTPPLKERLRHDFPKSLASIRAAA